MTMDEYQKKVTPLLIVEGDQLTKLMYLGLGLNGEAGEVADKLKRIIRDGNSDVSNLDKDIYARELGDVLWYIATLAEHLGLTLEQVAQGNIDKLFSRKARGKLTGIGDNR